MRWDTLRLFREQVLTPRKHKVGDHPCASADLVCCRACCQRRYAVAVITAFLHWSQARRHAPRCIPSAWGHPAAF